MVSSCNICDFKPETYTAAQNVTLHGISSGLTIAGIGYVNWTFIDTQELPMTMCIYAIYIPSLVIWLLSLQQLITKNPSHQSNSFVGGQNGMIIIYNKKVIHFPCNPKKCLPMQKTEPGIQQFASFCACINNIPVYNHLTQFYIHAYNACTITQDTAASDEFPAPSNPDSDDDAQEAYNSSLLPKTTGLSKTQCNLLWLHHHFGHIGFSITQDWACNWQFELSKSLAWCKASICLACQYGSFKKCLHASSTCMLADQALAPGHFVSIDHMVSGSGGHIPFQVGHASNWQYKYCTLWANHYSKFLYSHLQETATSKEMIQESMETYKTYAACFDVQVKHIHSNNGVFTSTDFAKHLDICGHQHHSLCGFSAH